MSLNLDPVASHVARRSPLSRRVVLAVDGALRSDWSSAHTTPTVARAGAARIFDQGLSRPFFNHLNSGGDAGLGQLVTYDEFASAVRVLVDDLLDPGGPGWVIEALSDGVALELAVAVYPDARVVRPGEDLARAVAEPAPLPGVGHPTPPDLTDHLILVVGAPRSGTTWFERLLMSHPLAGGIDEAESWLFRSLSDLWRNHGGGSGLAEIVDAEHLARAIRGFSSRLLAEGLAKTPSAQWFVEKTPGHVFLLPEIAKVWPDAWVINLVRDGRDVARSGAEMIHGPRDLQQAARGWAASIEAADEHAPALRRFREVRYEQVLADPVGVTVEVLQWAGLPVDDDVRSAVAAAAGKRVSQYNTSGAVGAGKWRELDAAELRIVLAVAGDALVKKGYVDRQEVVAARRSLHRLSGRIAELRRRRRRRSPRASD